MRILYLLINVVVFIIPFQAQVTLINGFNQPVQGDVNTKLIFDSIGIVPKTSGSNQLWDFSAFPITSNVEVSNYISASTTNGASYTNTSFAENYGQTYFYMRALPATYEIVGIENPSFNLNFSNNSALQFMWPVSMGYSKSDAFSGTVQANGMNGSVSGNIVTTAPGTGTLIAPGGAVFTDVLQVKVRFTAAASFLFGLATANLKAVDYTYYDASHKFPLITVSYINATGAYSANSVLIKVNSSIVGINDLNFDTFLNVFPNPAKDNFIVKLSNQHNTPCNVEIFNSCGQTVKSINLGNNIEISENISISDLVSGMYIVKTTLGEKVSARKLIVE